MNEPTKTKRNLRVGLAALAAATGLVLSGGLPASAAPGHYNTDPYLTGCAASRYAIAPAVPKAGGWLTTMYSTQCQTNWVEWSGPKTCTMKRIQAPGAGQSWTKWENDSASWSYSMQVYAPGNTKIDIEYAITPSWFQGGRCGGQAWDYSHEIGSYGWLAY